jgi:hypothetical protein
MFYEPLCEVNKTFFPRDERTCERPHRIEIDVRLSFMNRKSEHIT